MADRKDERAGWTATRPATCISADELAALIAGAVAPERVEAILVHVDHCTACAEVMTNLAQLEADPRELGRYDGALAIPSAPALAISRTPRASISRASSTASIPTTPARRSCARPRASGSRRSTSGSPGTVDFRDATAVTDPLVSARRCMYGWATCREVTT